MNTCSICATILATTDDKKSPKTSGYRTVPCCGRIICSDCIENNARFAAYCPYCQITTGPSLLPQGLRAPPPYQETPSSTQRAPGSPGQPPPYSRTFHAAAIDDDNNPTCTHSPLPQDILHFLDHDHDSITSLSLRYGVPQDALRRANRITSDHLLRARKTVLIPATSYPTVTVSLSPRPLCGEAEELRRVKIRRLMTACKLADYDVARLYLERTDYCLQQAIDSLRADEAWEQQARRRQDKQVGWGSWLQSRFTRG